jgi:hypothetical protein
MVVTVWVKMSGEMVDCRQGKTRETERQFREGLVKHGVDNEVREVRL